MLCKDTLRDNRKFSRSKLPVYSGQTPSLLRANYSRMKARLSTLLILMVMMTLGTTGAWGQTDYSGFYYIGSVGYKPNSTTANYYLCPTESWFYFQPTNVFTGTVN